MPGLKVTGDWDLLGMRGTNSRDLVLKDVFVTEDDLMMPKGIFIKTLPNWLHMMATLSPTYMGVAQGAFDFYRRLPAGPHRGPAAHRPADVCDQAHGGRQDKGALRRCGRFGGRLSARPRVSRPRAR